MKTLMRHQAGYTLIELVTYTVIMAISFAVLSVVISKSTDAYLLTGNQMMYIETAHKAAQLVERDILNVRSAAGILIATGTQFKFYHSNGQIIDMTTSNQTLRRNNVLLMSNLIISFTYLLRDGSTWTSSYGLSRIARVKYTISILGTSISHTVSLRNVY